MGAHHPVIEPVSAEPGTGILMRRQARKRAFCRAETPRRDTYGVRKAPVLAR